MSYELARYCIRALAHDRLAIVAFANRASAADGGETAAEAIFGGSLGGLIHQFFGEGNWSPQPSIWSSSERIAAQTLTAAETDDGKR